MSNAKANGHAQRIAAQTDAAQAQAVVIVAAAGGDGAVAVGTVGVLPPLRHIQRPLVLRVVRRHLYRRLVVPPCLVQPSPPCADRALEVVPLCIVVGLGVAALHNKFYKIELPQVLAFFGGTRFVPIISSIVYLVVGIAMFYIWPVVQSGIAALGALVLASGYAGTFIYGLLERALIPFGLHHVFYMPFWQTAVGGTAIIDGVTVTGAQNIFFAELASKSTTVFSVSATRFMAGKFPFMMFGLPGAALAMYQCAKPEKKKAAGGLLLSAALTAFLTGITEPLEFTFIFVALPMYAVHCVRAGLSFMLMHILNVGVGMTFSGGLIDLVLFGVMQGNAKTHWVWVVVVGAVYFVLYYIIFRFMISKFAY